MRLSVKEVCDFIEIALESQRLEMSVFVLSKVYGKAKTGYRGGWNEACLLMARDLADFKLKAKLPRQRLQNRVSE